MSKIEIDQEEYNELLRDIHNIYVYSRDNMPWINDKECRKTYNIYMQMLGTLLRKQGVF